MCPTKYKSKYASCICIMHLAYKSNMHHVKCKQLFTDNIFK